MCLLIGTCSQVSDVAHWLHVFINDIQLHIDKIFISIEIGVLLQWLSNTLQKGETEEH